MLALILFPQTKSKTDSVPAFHRRRLSVGAGSYAATGHELDPGPRSRLLAKAGRAVAGDGGGRVSVVELAIDLLKTDNASGYHSVFKVASNTKPWQAKVYLRPKTQRNLGSFATTDEGCCCSAGDQMDVQDHPHPTLSLAGSQCTWCWPQEA